MHARHEHRGRAAQREKGGRHARTYRDIPKSATHCGGPSTGDCSARLRAIVYSYQSRIYTRPYKTDPFLSHSQVSSLLANSFCELASVATLTSFMATFHLPSAGDSYDDNTGAVNVVDGVYTLPRTTDYNNLVGQALRLLAIELCFSFLNAFAQHRFHDIDLRRPFNLAEKEGLEDGCVEHEDDGFDTTTKGNADTGNKAVDRNGKKPEAKKSLGQTVAAVLRGRRLRTYVVMATFFAMCVVGTLLGTLWTVAVCPRVRRSDGHLFFSFCEPTEAKVRV